MKTAVTVLQEMMVKLGQTPDYECIAQSGPQHQAMFEYRCAALGAAVTAAARSKKEAKQESARLMLLRLAALGHRVPPPYGLQAQNDNVSVPSIPKGIRLLRAPSLSPRASASAGESKGDPSAGAAERKRPAPAHSPRPANAHSPLKRPKDETPSTSGAPGGGGGGGGASAVGAGEAGGGGGARSYVALLKELCEEYRLPGAEYDLVSDTGPPHLRHFTVAARVGHLTRQATATTKKAARQLAADQLYHYLRENLARLTKDFVEEDALVRAHEKAMERYLETREERRPDLGQRIADYHLEPAAWDAALRALESSQAGGLEAALAAMGLEASAATLDAAGGPLHLITVDAASPPLAFAGTDPQRARAAAARYILRALRRRDRPQTD